jgi:N-hydroxyarylamine O-acetyltransferase
MRLHDYLERVRVSEPLTADVESLRRLHVAHREAFLFENISIQAGGGVSVALEDIERKFLDEGRGGYCFEHNTLFATALREIGFAVTALLGRVRRGPPERWCRTHMVLRVTIGGEPWLADVGFGGIGLLEPIAMRDGARSEQVGLIYTLRREAHVWSLRAESVPKSVPESVPESVPDSVPEDLYEFSEDPQTPGDVEVANHYTSTHPDSMFRRTLTIQRTTRAERTILRQNIFTRYVDGRIEERAIDNADARAIARDVFGVTLPDAPLVYQAYRP